MQECIITTSKPTESTPLNSCKSDSSEESYKHCGILIFKIIIMIILLILAIIILLLLVIWLSSFRGGFDWDPNSHLFNNHPFFMTLGLIITPMFAVFSYRFLPFTKIVQKICHVLMLTLAIAFSIIGLTAIVHNKIATDHTHFWSIHSWIGLSTLILFYGQFIFGFFSYMFPIERMQSFRRVTINWHKYFGLLILLSATLAILTGTNEFLVFGTSATWRNYNLTYVSYAPEGILANFFAYSVFISIGIVSTLLIGPLANYVTKATKIVN